MENVRNYLTRESWQRDLHQTREDLGNVVSALKNSITFSALENEAGRVATGVIARWGVIWGGAGALFYGIAQNSEAPEIAYGVAGLAAAVAITLPRLLAIELEETIGKICRIITYNHDLFILNFIINFLPIHIILLNFTNIYQNPNANIFAC